MARRGSGAVAVDLGASSGRFAAGWIEDGLIQFEVVEQTAHAALESEGRAVWDIDALLGICRRAIDYAAAHFDRSTVGIDAWGVDHGFVDDSGSLIQPPVCYRDPSHVRAFQTLAPQRRRLYELTGIQGQPFNTISQLMARKLDSPRVVGKKWLILPDLLGQILTGESVHELTQASTTQLMGLDGNWSEEAFSIAGWPCPADQPSAPGVLGALLGDTVRLAHVGSHDTASAVAGFGELREHQAFLNLGTWSLLGTLTDKPLATEKADDAGFTNEWTIDARVRFLKNIPGFYVVNRLHEDLGVKSSVADWLGSASKGCPARIDLFDAKLFNPDSMLGAACAQLDRSDFTEAQWAEIALESMAETAARQLAELQAVTGRRFSELRVGGGGSRSERLCRAIANASKVPVLAGPTEATVVGNLAAQFLATGEIADHSELRQVVSRSVSPVSYDCVGVR